PRHSSRQDVAVQRVEGAAALAGGSGLRSQGRRAQHIAQGRAGRAALLHLLSDAADLLQQAFGILVASLQLVRDLPWNSTLGGVVLDIFDHLDLGRAVIADDLAGLLRRGMPVAGGLDQLALLLRVFPQGKEAVHAGLRRTATHLARWRRWREGTGA